MGVKKPKTEPLGLGFGCTIGNSSGERWGEVVWWCVGGSGGAVVLHLVTQVQMVGLGPNVQNRAAGAQFGCTVGNGCGGRWGGVVEWWV